METTRFAEVLLPLPLEGTFTYNVPTEFLPQLSVGCRVLVPFGNQKVMTGIVLSMHAHLPDSPRIKFLIAILDDSPFLKEETLSFWSWIAAYYCCSMGEVFNAALPAALKPTTVGDERGQSRIYPTETFVRLVPAYQNNPETLVLLNATLGKAKLQQRLMQPFIVKAQASNEAVVFSKKELLQAVGTVSTALKSLCDKGVLELFQAPVSQQPIINTGSLPVLDTFQEAALADIKHHFERKPVCLLHGYTSSGKTAVYMHLIQQSLDDGKQALYLVPEIALTSQLAERLRRVFGSKLGIYHSGLSEKARLDVWRQLREDTGCLVVLGVRSSVFLPFNDLGLVVVDEEHDGSYKQQEPAPRYHARNAVMVLAAKYGAKTLLGSATPSLETYARCLKGNYGLTTLFHRYGDAQLPEVVSVDVKDLKRRKKMKSLFSPVLIDAMQAAFEASEQVILFQNRRGFAPVLSCNVCDWVPQCPYCQVALTFHKLIGRLTCHYCGQEQRVPTSCPVCGTPHPTTKGFGTEQVEEEVHRLFPDIKTVRLDTDTSKNLSACTHIIEQFHSGKAQVLVGTQLVSKGLDFDRVKVVGILNADQMLSFPDFRSHERAFQLMAQVGGRGGRTGRRGLVIIQTSHPENPIVQQVIRQDYTGFFNEEMIQRQLFAYPPYTRVIHLSFRHESLDTVQQAAHFFAQRCRLLFGDRLLGPDQPAVSRIRNQHRQSMFLKLELTASLSEAKKELYIARDEMKRQQAFRSVQLILDVDPV